MLGKTIFGRWLPRFKKITTTYMPRSEAQDRGPLTGHVVIAYGLPDQPGPGLALTTGVRPLDVVGYDGHVNDDYQ